MSKIKHLYDCNDYKEYLGLRADQERGMKSALATALNCQSAYISQVLNNNAHLSLEQADAANAFLKHSEKESLYFMLLVQQARAGTQSLKKFFSEQLRQFQEEQLSYLNRRNIRNSLSEKDQAVYYSSWEYNAIHMAVTIPRLRTKTALMEAFNLSDDRTNRCLEFLLEKGLIKHGAGKYLPGTTENYLERSSPFVRQLHLNTRALAIQSLDRDVIEDAHYSATFTLSKEDVLRVKKKINEVLAEIVEIAKDSKETQITALTIDFFNMEK